MKIVFAFCAFLLTLSAWAQPGTSAPGPRVVADKIVGRVGDRIILQSDIRNAIEDYRRQGAESQLPPNPECVFMEGQLIQKALVLQANKDSLQINDEELEALLDNQIRGFVQQYGSKEVLEQIAGKTVYQIKEDLREPFKERKLSDQMRSKIVDNIKITPAEASAYFNQIPKDSLPYYESELELQQLVIFPKANPDVEAYVMRELYEFKRQSESGNKPFEQLVKLYSEDPGKEQSLTYNLNRSDKQWDPAFFNAVWRLKEGQISPVVKSKFGYHIIKLVSRNGDDAVVAHILRVPAVSQDEVNLANNRLDSIRNLILKGDMTFTMAINKFTEDDDAKFTGGSVMNQRGSNILTIDELDKDVVPVLKDLQVGGTSRPHKFTGSRGKQGVRLVYLKSRTEPHRENLKDDYNRIASRALEEKKSTALEKWFASHIPNYYILIDDQYNHCSNIANWKTVSLKASK